MKKLTSILVMMFSALIGFSQSRISLLDDKIFFQLPSGVLQESQFPKFATIEEARKYRAEKIILSIQVENEEIFRKEDPFWLPEKFASLLKKDRISHSDYLSLLDPSDIYNLSRRNIPNIDESYSLFEYKNEYIGEAYAFASIEGSFFPVEYGFVLKLIVDTSLVTIRLKLYDESFNIPQQLPEYFYFDDKYNTYMWRQNIFDSRAKFYRQLVSKDNSMPSTLKLLYEHWVFLINSIEIN
jgi:hypothetical protein